ncbi:hypothetical protein ACFWOQ_36785, partial [Streptomyces rubiginosohelvolus]
RQRDAPQPAPAGPTQPSARGLRPFQPEAGQPLKLLTLIQVELTAVDQSIHPTTQLDSIHRSDLSPPPISARRRAPSRQVRSPS